MQKVRIVKQISFLVMIAFTLISCQQEQLSDDQQLLELVLKEKQNQSNSIYLNQKGDSKRVTDFFRLRQRKQRTFTIEYKDSISPIDTLTPRKGKIVYKNRKVKSNNYITWGKGIDKKTEDFLKDSFDYKQERIINWTLPKTLKNVSIEKKGSENYKKIRVSAPVYNLNKSKAILFTIEQSNKNTAVQSIYFVKKYNDVWNIIYQEELDWFLDLKIE